MRFFKKPKMEEVSTLEGEMLTDDEMKRIREGACCPDCGGRLLEGPCGGASMNVKCDKCGAEYNLGPVFSERITDSKRIDGGLSITDEGGLSLAKLFKGWLSRSKENDDG